MDCNIACDSYYRLMRLVLDTVVVVAGVRSALGASRRLLTAALDRQIAVLLSVPLAIEYEAVLTRPEHLGDAGIGTADVGVLLDALVLVAEPVTFAYLWRPALRDPDDDMVLETAVNGGADAIVTFNCRDFLPETARFGIAVLRPQEILMRMDGS